MIRPLEIEKKKEQASLDRIKNMSMECEEEIRSVLREPYRVIKVREYGLAFSCTEVEGSNTKAGGIFRTCLKINDAAQSAEPKSDTKREW
jgi:hypothetical protein